MWSSFVQSLDRLAIRSACGSVRPSPDGDHHAAEAIELLHQRDFFAPEVAPAAPVFSSDEAFSFPAPIQTGVAVNDTVRGRMMRANGEWKTRPSVILLHGWNAELQYQWMVPFWSELLARAGINAIAFELPYHGSRRPGRDNGTIRNYLSGNLLHVMRTTQQTLAEVRALALWLRSQGSPAVTVWGVSLGAWLSGLAVAHQPELHGAVLLTPVARMDRALRELAFCDPIRDQVIAFEKEFGRLNLVSHRPLVPSNNVLVVAPSHDLFAPRETIEELEASWQPELWRCSHGHISVLLSTKMMRRIVKWIADHSGPAVGSGV